MRRSVYYLICGVVLSVWMACSKKESHPAGEAALMYYGYLINGQYAEYINSIAYSDSMTDEYKSQMVDLTAQYMAREKEQRGGLVNVRLVGDTIADNVASAFIEVVYGDSTREEISVPMVLCNGIWKLQ